MEPYNRTLDCLMAHVKTVSRGGNLAARVIAPNVRKKRNFNEIIDYPCTHVRDPLPQSANQSTPQTN